MNFENKTSIPGRIEKTFSLLDEEHMRKEIDESIEKAAAGFRFDQKEVFTYAHFKRLIADFVKHIYEHGLMLPQKISSSYAFTEAVDILEKEYQSAYAMGYEAARLDASSPEMNGAIIVLSGMTETIKRIERRKYIQGVFRIHIVHLDWHERCKIAEFLIKSCSAILPSDLLERDHAQFADDLPDLIMHYLQTENLLKQLLSGTASLKHPR